ncbi:hypothetical protein ACOI22_14280 [Glaciecola sp. 2405UD65-10]|uniref:hypothetical protein n=1 Tax=Glaciecola sp. 2405UD65-10 TaxID=3397244 RepID=UPI003B5A77C2
MHHDSSNWNIECIRERFTLVKTEITDRNRRITRFIVALIITAVAVIIASILYFQEKVSGVIILGVIVVTVFTGIAIIFITVNSSEKCVSKLTICLLTLDDKDIFFKAVSEIPCGGDGIMYFLQFVDKATRIIEVSNPAGSAAAPAVQQGSK